MAVWFTQNRSDINRLSTKALIEWAKAEVDTARHFVRVDNPEGSSTDMLRSARWAVEMVFDDGPAAVVMGEGAVAGYGRARIERLVRYRDIRFRAGDPRRVRTRIAGGCGTRGTVDSTRGCRRRCPERSKQGVGAQSVSEKMEAARQQVGAAEVGLVSTVQSPVPRSEVSESIDRVQDAAPRYRQAATASGRQIVADKDQASQQQAGWTAGQEAQTGVTHQF